jgi:hypothetical protein
MSLSQIRQIPLPQHHDAVALQRGAAPRATRLLASPAALRVHPRLRKAAAPPTQVRSAAALAAGRCAAAFPAEAAPWRPELWPLLRGLLDENVPSVREDGAGALADAARAWGPALLDLLLPALRCARGRPADSCSAACCIAGWCVKVGLRHVMRRERPRCWQRALERLGMPGLLPPAAPHLFQEMDA